MSADRMATVTPLPSRATPDPEQALPAIPEPAAPKIAPVVKQVARQFNPPDIYDDDRPSLKKLWLYAAWGRWTRNDGFLRFAGKAYTTVIAWPGTAILYTLAWIIERPARLAVAAMVYGLIRLTF